MELNPTELREKNNLDMHQGEHIILRLTYVSRYNTENANVEVARILEQAQRNNERKGITGALVINENYFIQVIEGARPVINDLLSKLINDKRHFNLDIIECREVDERRWNTWSMKYLTISDQNQEYVLKYSATNEFKPYLMTASQIMMFIEKLSEI
ncbi:BLUF domain-containing protein [Psychrobacter proteolyticus]|uniref:BLUF domain-containing protein n=1 Tax=Psychrobacter proteolyticus TaxID=147825 RepID=UPI000E0CA0BE|nr:BLUF domain-containing protein [Psychrobacter proteolyticus]